MSNDTYGKWTPCSERLPKIRGRYRWYLVQIKDGKMPMMILNYHSDYELFGEIEKDKFLGDDIKGEPIAWRPLPEPYNGGVE